MGGVTDPVTAPPPATNLPPPAFIRYLTFSSIPPVPFILCQLASPPPLLLSFTADVGVFKGPYNLSEDLTVPNVGHDNDPIKRVFHGHEKVREAEVTMHRN